MKTVLTIAAFALLVAFLGILVRAVPRLDLGLVVGATLLLAFWDLFCHDRLRLRRSARDMAAREAEALDAAGRGVSTHDAVMPAAGARPDGS